MLIKYSEEGIIWKHRKKKQTENYRPALTESIQRE